MAGEGLQKGWVSLYRSIQDHWLWQEKPFSKGQAWLDLLLSANHQDRKIIFDSNLYEVTRGSFITSIRKLCEKWGWSNSKVKKFLDLLQDDGMITYKSDSKKTTINIANYEVYQSLSDTKNVTETSQTNHRDITETPQKHTNNNDNNDNNLNNDNKDIYTEALELCKYYGTLLPGQSITSHLATLKMYIEMYGFDWTKEAMQKTIKNIKRFNLGYMEKILKGWVENGKEDTNGRVKQDNKSNKEQGEGELLAERAQKLYGDKIQDIKCDF